MNRRNVIFVKTTEIIIISLCIILLILILPFYAIQTSLIGFGMLLTTILFIKIGWKNSLVMTISIVSTTLIINYLLMISGVGKSMYYRDHEMLTYVEERTGLLKYFPNANIKLIQPYGDLYAMSHMGEKESRSVDFVTDSLGFRNENEYENEKFILVGDSFVVGNGNSQKDILSSQLRRDFDIGTYNVAYPGNIVDYYKSVARFRTIKGVSPRILLFIFEGNDFEDTIFDGNTKYEPQTLKEGIEIFYKNSDIYRFFDYSINLIKKERNKLNQPSTVNTELVFQGSVKAIPVLFFKPYIEVVKRKKTTHKLSGFEESMGSMKGQIEYVFFIPDKYRVYYNNISTTGNLPNAQWEYLKSICEKLNIPIVNLTQPLIEEAATLLADGRFVYWRDDTHWNKYGISVAARIVAEKIKEGKR